VLELLLNALVSLSLSYQNAPVEDLVATLEEEHDVNRDVTRQVMRWFGQIEDDIWQMDVDATVTEIGLGILRAYRVCPHMLYSTVPFNTATAPCYTRRTAIAEMEDNSG
jgi:sister chromatid cohesion protein DCC1